VSFRVPHLEPAQRFSVALPDGELEVRGTEFTVVVDGGRTMAVNVTDGAVALRIDGRPETVLHAGDLWPEPPAIVAAAGSVDPIASGSSAAPAVVHAARAASHGPSPGALFDDAFASFEHGAYAEADRKLERFVREHPSEPRAEDAAYLRAVARFRLGDREGAAALARAYLEANPSGLRRLEARRLASMTDR
jgi:TolA-binding protein